MTVAESCCFFFFRSSISHAHCLDVLGAVVVSSMSKPLRHTPCGGVECRLRTGGPALQTQRGTTRKVKMSDTVHLELHTYPSPPSLLPTGQNPSPRLRKSATVKESKKRRSGGITASDKHQPPAAPESGGSQPGEEFPPEDVNVLRSGNVKQGVRVACVCVCV